MKVQDFAYNVASEAMNLLEQEQHYKIAEETRKKVLKEIVAKVNDLAKQSR